MSVPRKLRYTKTHEWVRMKGSNAVVGITDFAQEQLGDLTYVELPTVGDSITSQEEVAVVESVKAASDIYAPASGTVTAINEKLVDHPEIINADAYEDGWLFEFTPDDPSEIESLMDSEEYEKLLPESE